MRRTSSPAALERGERAAQVVRERDDVVDDRRPVGVLAGLARRRRRRPRSRARRAARPRGRGLASWIAAGGAPAADARRSPIGAPGAKPRRAQSPARRPGARSADGHEDECDRAGVTPSLSADRARPPPHRREPAPPPAPEPDTPPSGARARLARVLARAAVSSWPSPAWSGGRSQTGAARACPRPRASGWRWSGRSRSTASRRSCAASAGSGCSSTRAARPRASTPMRSTCVGYMGNNVLPARAGDAIRVGADGAARRHARCARSSARCWPSGCSTSPCSS